MANKTPYENLIAVVREREEMEKKINQKRLDFEQSILVEKTILDDLKEKEQILRQEVLLALEEEKRNNVKTDDRLIVKQIKTTIKPEQPTDILSAIKSKEKELSKVGVDVKKVSEAIKIEPKIVNRSVFLKAIESYENLFGELPNGAKRTETKFITIKKI